MYLRESSDIPESLIDTFEQTLGGGVDRSNEERMRLACDLEFPNFLHAVELAGGSSATDEEIVRQAFATVGVG